MPTWPAPPGTVTARSAAAEPFATFTVAEVTLTRRGDVIARERGEVLLRSYGLSGIVIFDMSRIALPNDLLANVGGHLQ